MTLDQETGPAASTASTAPAAAPEPGGPPAPVLPAGGRRAPRTGLSRLSLTQIYRIGSVVLTTVLILALTQAAIALVHNNDARDGLTGHVDPATLEQFRLGSAVGRQDTAIRNYAADGDRARLADYRDAIADEAAAAASIRRDLAGVAGTGPTRQRLEAVERASAAWRRGFAEPLAAGSGQGISEAAEAAGRDLFAGFRAANVALQGALTSLHGKVSENLRDAAVRVYWSVGAAFLIVVLAAILLALVISRTVLHPVRSLTGRVRAVSQGDYEHGLDVGGPAEIAELAAIVDAMRNRILQEWRAATEARAVLDEQATELRRSNAELEQFAYVASHDLQEPLRKVASFCQMLDRRYADRLDDRGRQYIEFAVDGSKRMQSLISDLLGFSRVGRMSAMEDGVALDAVVDRAVDNLSALIEETGATVERAELPAVHGDRSQLGQLFQNLVGNAVKFRREGVAPHVRITAERKGDEWEFACADNGIGIEPRYADRIFLIFQRLHAREEYSGTGIGLALCKKIVEYHGGRIWLDSPEDRAEGTPGTTIRWTMPAAAGPAGDAPAEGRDGDD
ncbi:sensor histidine kinase [Actinomadura parmotrematis]|uniref:histidine kinase n=1 Tax=Actinomadura parmotrematis TaxID=2864039 RepID=A0ABS7FNU5_9ACTN|nr:ATP-binding protein [Actinomadura parmotrematis]MBW8482026.1 HAMP domain-containing protein [Actinomadura parmotrematis]